MIRQFKAALCAATFLCATQAHAANFLVVDISAVGTGTTFRNVGSDVVSSPFTTLYASLAYNLEGQYAPRVNGNTLSVTGSIFQPLVLGTFTATGFDFTAALAMSRVTYNIVGKGCYANSSPTTLTTGSPAVDSSCSPFSINYGNGSAMESLFFTGALEGINFRVVEADTIPSITFAIPEPSTWALMLAGFALTGYALRRRRARVAFA